MVEVVRMKMPAGVHGRTDGKTIYVDEDLNEVQLFCTIVHELIHIERGQGTRQLESEEFAVRYETARRLLPASRMRDCGGGKLSETARRLGVTKRVLMDRAATMTDQEATEAGCWDCHACPAIAARASRMTAYGGALLGHLLPLFGFLTYL